MFSDFVSVDKLLFLGFPGVAGVFAARKLADACSTARFTVCSDAFPAAPCWRLSGRSR